MSLPHYFLDEQVLADEASETFPLALSREDAKHGKVARLAPGEHIAVIDAAQDYFECEVVSFDAALPVVRIAGRIDAAPLAATVALAQGLAKGDKMETVIRHATELGVRRFLPFSAARSIMKVDPKKASSKTERWQAIAKSAAMQSGQAGLARVDAPRKLSALCAELAAFDAVLVCWEEAPGTASVREALACVAGVRQPAVAIVVGPEGGLSTEEVDAILSCNPHSSLVTLGPSILRTETAGVVAPALALYELGGLGAKGVL